MTTVTPRVKWLIDCPEEGYCRHNNNTGTRSADQFASIGHTSTALQTNQQFQSVKTPQKPKWDPGSAQKRKKIQYEYSSNLAFHDVSIGKYLMAFRRSVLSPTSGSTRLDPAILTVSS
jgi:hypothetical protein